MPIETVGTLLRDGETFLRERDVPDAPFDARCLLAFCLEQDLSHLRLMLRDAADSEVRAHFSALLERRAAGEPLQYILGSWDFYDRTFFVREGVLIPRPETEFLAEFAIRHLPRDGVLFDLCAGSGCIGITAAAHRPDVHVYLIEKYPIPLQLERENVHLHALQNVRIVPCDALCAVPPALPVPDGIVSNPPYICTNELPGLQREVQREPQQALDGGADGLCFYRAIRTLWFPLLRDGGFLAMECGEGQPRTLAGWFPAAQIQTDFTGTERFLTVTASHDRKGETSCCCS